MAILRRGVHLAERLQGRLVVLHVTQSSGLQPEGTEGYQAVVKVLQLARALGAEVVTRNATDVVDAVVAFAAEIGVTQLVLGEGSRSRWWHVGRQSLLDHVLQRTQDIDVHIVRRSER
jgi:K+-sensing histidine kinase KdpD